MFRQPPNNEVARQRYLQQSDVFGTAKKKLVKTKKAGIKRRKKTRDQFARERKAEEAFKFGETRSGLSGRKLYRGAKDIDKRTSAYRPDRLLAIHQSSLNNQTRDLKETQMGLTSVGTTLGLEKAQLEAVETKKKSEEMKVKLFSKIIDRLDSPTPLIGGYSNHRIPDGLNSGEILRLPDRPPTDLPHGSIRPPDSEGRLPTQQGYRSHRKPADSLAPLILETGIDLSRESSGPTISEIGSDAGTPLPTRSPLPKPKPLSTSKTQSLELQIAKSVKGFSVKPEDNAEVKLAIQNAESARRINPQLSLAKPQVRKPPSQIIQPEPEPEQLPPPPPTSDRPDPPVKGSIYDKWKQAGVVNRSAEEGTAFAPPEVTTTTKPQFREKIEAEPSAQQQAQLDAVERAKQTRKEKKERMKAILAEQEEQSRQALPLPETPPIPPSLSTATRQIAPVLPTAQIPPPRRIEPEPEPEPNLVPQPQPQPPDLSSIESKGQVEEVDESEDSWDSFFVDDREEQLALVLQSADNNYKLNPTKQHFKLVGNFAKIGSKGKFMDEDELVIGKFKKGNGGVVLQRGSITNKGINPQTKGNEASVAHAKLQKLIDSGEVRVEKISSDYSI
tara:strand:+ start:720 stop:2564 length:1845 start_codon:yes stop_codon:yes gene_type:complete